MTVREAADLWRKERGSANERFYAVLRAEVERGVPKQRVADEAGLSRTTLYAILRQKVS